MSPAAIDQRLREVAQLYRLGMSLQGARILGPIEPQLAASGGQPPARSGAASNTQH